MENRNIIGLLLLSCVLLMMALQSCDKQKVDTYDSEHALFFDRWKRISDVKRERIDTVGYSFSHYVGETELVHDFKISLIGNILSEDTEYKVVVVDSLTTALPEQYTLPKHPMFHEGQSTDVFSVVLHKTESLKDKEVYLTLRLVQNENFALGYVGYRDVKIRFNDKIVKPLWWTDDVVKGYLGEYSFEKFETIVLANEGFTTFDGLSGTEKRKIALNTKDYIALHGITEKDGSPMYIPIY